MDDGFHTITDIDAEGLACVTNPDNCLEGISFSLFYYADYEETEAELFTSTTFEREYIVSTGNFFKSKKSYYYCYCIPFLFIGIFFRR